MEIIETQFRVSQQDIFTPSFKRKLISNLADSLAEKLANQLILPQPEVVAYNLENPYGERDNMVYSIKIEYRQLQT
jgi:hypothetical protein